MLSIREIIDMKSSDFCYDEIVEQIGKGNEILNSMRDNDEINSLFDEKFHNDVFFRLTILLCIKFEKDLYKKLIGL